MQIEQKRAQGIFRNQLKRGTRAVRLSLFFVPPLAFLLSYILLSQDPGQEAQIQTDPWDGVCLASLSTARNKVTLAPPGSAGMGAHFQQMMPTQPSQPSASSLLWHRGIALPSWTGKPK